MTMPTKAVPLLLILTLALPGAIRSQDPGRRPTAPDSIAHAAVEAARIAAEAALVGFPAAELARLEAAVAHAASAALDHIDAVQLSALAEISELSGLAGFALPGNAIGAIAEELQALGEMMGDAPVGGGFRVSPPAAWAPQDPADSLYRAAREALNGGDHARAADLFRQVAVRFPRSAYAGDALYWQAFARYRAGGAEQFRLALAALEQQSTGYASAATRSDAVALATRIRGELARLGDADAAETITKEANRPADACSEQDSEIRSAALNALLQMDAERAMPILKQTLQRRDGCSASLRKRAVFLVAQKVTPETEDILVDVARRDPDLDVRRSAVFHLSRVSTDKAVTMLEEILNGADDMQLRERALFALSEHRSERAARILRSVAAHPATPVELRSKAIFWVGQSGSAENNAFLRDLYRNLDDARLKERVLFSLAQSRGQGNERWLLDVALDSAESTQVRKKALFWAGEAGAPIQELVGLYDRMPDTELKEQLIFVYSQRKDAAAADKLIDIARNERDVKLRKKAIFWLSESKDPRVIQVLMEIIGNA